MIRRVLPLVGLAFAGALTARAARRRRVLRPTSTGPRVVILGAGFAGIAAARALGPRLHERAQVILVDQHNYHLFTPMLFQVASSGIDPYNIAVPARQVATRRGVDFRRGVIRAIDLDQKRVELEDGTLAYDYLIVALGAATNFHGNSGAQQHALPLKWLEDGIAVRHRVIDALEQAAEAKDPAERRALLTFVVVGGGATGVETAAALADLFDNTAGGDYPSLHRDEIRIIVLQSSDRLLPEWSERMSTLALDHLKDVGVEVWLNTRAKDVEPNRVTAEDGRDVETRTVIWTTGVRAPDVVATLDAPHGKGGSLAVDGYLQLEDHPGVFAAGDSAHVIDPKTNGSVPMLAQSATREGEAVAENVVRAIEGRPLEPFVYHSLGNAVSFGRQAGAVEVQGILVDGLLGGLAWRAIHVARITSLRDQIGTAIDWTSDYFGTQDTVRIELDPPERAVDQKVSSDKDLGAELDRRASS